MKKNKIVFGLIFIFLLGSLVFAQIIPREDYGLDTNRTLEIRNYYNVADLSITKSNLTCTERNCIGHVYQNRLINSDISVVKSYCSKFNESNRDGIGEETIAKEWNCLEWTARSQGELDRMYQEEINRKLSVVSNAIRIRTVGR